jgi:hypothetical protein
MIKAFEHPRDPARELIPDSADAEFAPHKTVRTLPHKVLTHP